MALKIIYMGTPEFAVPILKSLHNSKHSIIEVYTQPPKKKNRGQKINSTPIQKVSEKFSLNFRSPENLDSKQEYEYIKNLKPDVVVVVAYGKIIPDSFLSLKNTKFINIHASLLPKWRGAAPIQRAIMNLDEFSGISFMQIVSKLDAGPIIIKSKLNIDRETTYESLSKKMSELASIKILEVLELIESRKAVYIPQNDKEATYAKKIDKLETKINWKDSAKKNIAKINALYPIPGSWFRINNSRIKVVKALEVKKDGKPGEILADGLSIACSENAIQILKLQKEGKKEITTEEYLRGNKVEKGKILA